MSALGWNAVANQIPQEKFYKLKTKTQTEKKKKKIIQSIPWTKCMTLSKYFKYISRFASWPENKQLFEIHDALIIKSKSL